VIIVNQFTDFEIGIMLRCIDLYMVDDAALIHGIGLKPEVKSRLASVVLPKLASLSPLTSFNNREYMFIDMALNYAYRLYSSASVEYDLEDLASLIEKIERRLNV
jgi:hypothetical protein